MPSSPRPEPVINAIVHRVRGDSALAFVKSTFVIMRVNSWFNKNRPRLNTDKVGHAKRTHPHAHPGLTRIHIPPGLPDSLDISCAAMEINEKDRLLQIIKREFS
jgi:hypothetical protein